MDKEEHELQHDCECEDKSVYELVFDPIAIDTENLEEVEFDKDEFQKGLKDISCVCGKISGLVNVGLTVEDALNYLVNVDILQNNIKVSEINKEASVNVAKETTLQIEKNSL